ncbi:hypothetical protein KTT_54130 [Tengunoibacter tsumagoiensis]|uniref:Uncharacterized protein n=1 Tax=Tengunoibacter tsumagoiensis TaxID=2014871 RepID=A0A402A8Q1_9CHLR|nr:hypothetical protein KTT_54130 [Tengunoibacter tsumagoiensis]
MEVSCQPLPFGQHRQFFYAQGVGRQLQMSGVEITQKSLGPRMSAFLLQKNGQASQNEEHGNLDNEEISSPEEKPGDVRAESLSVE